MNIRGLIVPAITPLYNAAVDIPSLNNLLEFIINGGADSIFITGTTGEFQYLSFEEKQKIIKQAASSMRQRLPLLVGISAETVREILALAGEAEAHKAQATVLAPMFGPGKPAEKIDSVIQNSSLPVVLYNNPEIHRGEMLPLSIVSKYAVHPRIIGIKDSSGDWEYFLKLLELRSESFSILQGKESSILPSLLAGANGIVAGTANVNPGLFAKILSHQDEETMRQITELKDELKELAEKPIPALKQKLVHLGVINSAEILVKL